MNIMPHTINWFEIPVTDIVRAQKFYEAVLDMKLATHEMEGCKMAIFPAHEEKYEGPLVHGALVEMEGMVPSDKGSLIYFNGGADLAPYLERVKSNGGEVLQEKTSIGEHGHFGIFKDTEGNRLAFHTNL
jgi:hypothetical protein